MKKFLVTLFVLTILSIGAFAQTEEAAAPAAKPHKVYCEIISYARNIFSDKTTVELDFGQSSKWLSNDRKLVDEDGKIINFNSILDAANYMAERGWIFEEAYVVQSIIKGDSGIPNYHWIMSKEITDPSQITEGLQTQGMTK